MIKKLDFIRRLLQQNQIDILFLQETEIPTDYDLCLLSIEDYNLEIEMSETRRTCAYVKRTLHYKRRLDLEEKETHLVCLDILKPEKIRAIGLYRSFNPLNRTKEQLFEKQVSMLNDWCINYKEKKVILGDFNIDYLKMGTLNNFYYNELARMEQANGLTQLVKEVTWSRLYEGSYRSSLLDHCYLSDLHTLKNVKLLEAEISDHTPIMIELAVNKISEKRTILKRNWNNYSRDLLLEELRKIDWNIDCIEVQDINNELEQKLLTVVDKLVPVQEITEREKRLFEADEIRLLRKKRKNIFRNARRRQSARLLTRCRDLDKKIRMMSFRKQRNKIRENISSGNQRSLWEAVKIAKNVPQERIPSLIKDGIKHANTPLDQAQMFANFFYSKTGRIVKETAVSPTVFNGVKKLKEDNAEITITEEIVSKILVSLKEKNCHGFDRIPLRILRDGSMLLSTPYTKLFKAVISQCKVPEQWKTARIIPLHKKGDKEKVENYRPISNLCAPSKVFEKLLLQDLLKRETLSNVDLTNTSQHGFKKERSTVTAAMTIQSKLAQLLENNNYAIMASLDLSAAFDVVNRDLLLKRLDVIGLSQEFVKIIEEWLTNRKAYVEVEQSSSSFFPIQCGTVQGSVLGPVLFSLFISPIYELEDMISYADDSYIISGEKTKEASKIVLEKSINVVANWLKNSGMKVNVEKTEIVVFYKNDTAALDITVLGKTVVTKKSMNVLGILFESKLTWGSQVHKSIKKANQSLQGLKQIFRYFNCEENVKLLTAFYYSRLYYASQIWLHQGLNKSFRDQLYSASGRALRHLDRNEESYKVLHKKFKRAVPSQWEAYQLSILFYDIYNRKSPEDEWIFSQLNQVHNNRFKTYNFVSNNITKCGFNMPSNRLRLLNGKIEINMIDQSKPLFKTKCKEIFINAPLVQW